MEIIYQVQSTKSFDETVTSVEELTKANGFRVLHVHDVQQTLAEKNFSQSPLKIIEVCNASYAHSALQIEITVSLLMPCRINVFQKENQTFISTVRPNALISMFANPELEQFAQDIEPILLRIIDESV